jgi:hypothetical protein
MWCTDFALGDWVREHGKAISFGDINFLRALSSELCPTHLVHNLMFWSTDLMFGAPIEMILSLLVFIMPQKWCFDAPLKMLLLANFPPFHLRGDHGWIRPM